MRVIAQNYRTGKLTLVDAPVPACKPRGLLVRSQYSLISTGTELMKVGEAKLSLLGKIRARPDQVTKVLESVAQQGAQATLKKVMNRLDSYTPLGYSLCGRVIDVGAGVTEFSIGDRVVCAGNQYALHAEVNWVPINLCVPVPDGVDPRHAAFTTVGAVAMQGLRQAEPSLGEVACVIGLGLIGQLLVQLLNAAGLRVVGVDVSRERCELAKRLGAVCATGPDAPEIDRLHETISALTRSMGVDCVFLSAGGSSNGPVELAATLARDRGRVVDIGKCSLNLPWNAYYEKELDVRFSRSYGPGRYDSLYEEQGIDYPVGYVRWTEGRNLACFIDLLARKRIDLEPLVSKVIPFEEAVETYEKMNAGEMRDIGLLFEYDREPEMQQTVPLPADRAARRPSRDGVLRVGFIGCGNYASTMLLPHLLHRDDISLERVVTSTALSCVSAQRKFGFKLAGTSVEDLLADQAIDAVFVVTRHQSHASLLCKALRAGKAVFVEKPLAISREQLSEIVTTISETGNDRVMVGFNRRFCGLLTWLRREAQQAGPMLLRYLVNVGKLESTSWYAQTSTEGSRFCGEGGHFIDTFSWWLGAEAETVSAHGLVGHNEDVVATLTFADGSVGTIMYTTIGSSRFPKETFEALGSGVAVRLDNFRTATRWARGRPLRRWSLNPDKGQRSQLAAFIDALRDDRELPITVSSAVATTAATLAVEESRVRGGRVRVEIPT